MLKPNNYGRSDAFGDGRLTRRTFVKTLAIGGGASVVFGCGGGGGGVGRTATGGGSSGLPAPVLTPGLPTIKPGDEWNGTAGSGFAFIPADPERITAKPACRLLVPPFQAFSSFLAVGVSAAANAQGSMFENFGLEKVCYHYEGNRLEITSPSFHTFNDVNGNEVSYFGWWAALEHNGISGSSCLYIEAVPQDASMQTRIIGPYKFAPREHLYDLELEVAPSAASAGGLIFGSIAEALAHAKSQDAQFPRIMIKEGGEYTLGPVPGKWHSGKILEGWCTIEATQPVLISRPFENFEPSNSMFRPNAASLHWRGGNITFDFANAIEYYETSSRSHWFDGINLTNTLGRNVLWRKRPRVGVVSQLVRNAPYFTECHVSNLNHCYKSASLVRGGEAVDCYGDIFDHAACVTGHKTDTVDSSFYRSHIDALEVTYFGKENNATISIDGYNMQDNRQLIITWGDHRDVFYIKSKYEDYVEDSNYSISNVVEWINSHEGWSAKVLDDSRLASSLTLNNVKGGAGFPPQDVKDRTVVCSTFFDIHSDWYQKQHNVDLENIIVSNCVALNLVTCQDIFLTGRGGMKDIIFINNAFWNSGDSQIEPRSQFASEQSHVVVAHNTLANQGIYLRLDQDFKTDQYSMVSNNISTQIAVIGEGSVNLLVQRNHLLGDRAGPDGAIETTIGGDSETFFVDARSGDFSPTELARAYPSQPVVLFDIFGKPRPDDAAKGAVV